MTPTMTWPPRVGWSARHRHARPLHATGRMTHQKARNAVADARRGNATACMCIGGEARSHSSAAAAVASGYNHKLVRSRHPPQCRGTWGLAPARRMRRGTAAAVAVTIRAASVLPHSSCSCGSARTVGCATSATTLASQHQLGTHHQRRQAVREKRLCGCFCRRRQRGPTCALQHVVGAHIR